MKYKILKDEELKELEKEFVEFLITNGVDGDSWKKINDQKPDKAIALVELFSDIVWERALKKIQIVEHVNKGFVQMFHYQFDKAKLVGIKSMSETVDFKKQSWKDLIIESPEKFELFSQERKLDEGVKEQEVFDLLQSGCQIGVKEDFDWLVDLFEKVKN